MNHAQTKSTPANKQAGFTLVELLVAFTLFSLLSLLLLGALRFGTKAWERSNQHASRLNETVHAQSLLRRLIGNAYPSFITQPAGAGYVEFDGDARSLTFLSQAPMSLDHGGRLRFTLISEQRGEKTDLVLGSRTELVAGEASGAPTRRALLNRVATVNIGYFGRKRGGGAAQWHQDWRRERELPELIRIEVTFAAGDAASWPDLIIRPRVEADVSCVYDTFAKRCRGR